MIALLTTLATLAAGAGAEPATVMVHLQAEKREYYVDGSGTERVRLVAVDIPPPGEEIFYTVSFGNPVEESLEAVTVIQPVPAGMVYIAGTAVGPGTDVAFSIDGGQSYASAEELLIDAADETSAPAPPERYTHIRWVMRRHLEAGATALARFRARRAPDWSPAAPGATP